MKISIIFSFCLLLGVIGQALVKIGANKINYNISSSTIKFYCVNIISNINLIIGLIFYVFSMILYIYILSKMEFSKAAPIMSLSYVFALIVGNFYFDESINFIRIMGVFLIITGVIFISRS